jgi:hypothetical protein
MDEVSEADRADGPATDLADSRDGALDTADLGGEEADVSMEPDEDAETDADAAFDPDADAVPAALEISLLFAVENPSNVLSFFVEWRTNRPATTVVEVDCGDALSGVIEEPVVSYRTEHQVFLMGLFEGANCTFTASSVDSSSLSASRDVVIDSVGPLPDGFPTYTVNSPLPELVQPGWTLFATATIQSEIGEPLLLNFVDEVGRIRWYSWRPYIGLGSGGWESQVVEEGVLIGGQHLDSAIISWQGEAVWNSPFQVHHDIEFSPFSDDAFLYLWYSREGCPEGLVADVVNEFDRGSGEVVWSWSICGHYEPPVVFDDWSHLNDIEPVPDERAFLVSSRNQDAIFRVDRDTGEIDWHLGIHGDFELDEGATFYRQHALEIQDDGTILFFDNGQAGVRESSRALQLELTFDDDRSPLSAERVWDYHDEELFCIFRGDADRLENDNTLITYSLLKAQRQSLLREVGLEGSEVWELWTPQFWNIYRSERVDVIPLGIVATEE